MKNIILLFSVFILAQCKPEILRNDAQVRVDENGELIVSVSEKDMLKFKSDGFVRYGDFGARGDGKTDDFDIIAGTHKFANPQTHIFVTYKNGDGALTK